MSFGHGQVFNLCRLRTVKRIKVGPTKGGLCASRFPLGNQINGVGRRSVIEARRVSGRLGGGGWDIRGIFWVLLVLKRRMKSGVFFRHIRSYGRVWYVSRVCVCCLICLISSRLWLKCRRRKCDGHGDQREQEAVIEERPRHDEGLLRCQKFLSRPWEEALAKGEGDEDLWSPICLLSFYRASRFHHIFCAGAES